MISKHPITPPPELIAEWWDDTHGAYYEFEAITIQAARWGADQELEACCKWLPKLPPWSADDLRRHRRPKPPSLKGQALAMLDDASDRLDAVHENTIRRALEALND